VVLPVILLLIDWFQGRNLREKNLWIEKVPYVGLSTVFGIVALFGKAGNAESWSLTETILIGSKSAIFYLTKLFVPTNLSPLYPYTDEVAWMSVDLLVPVIIVLGVMGIAIWVAVETLYHSVSSNAESSPQETPWYGVSTVHAAVFAWSWYILLLLPTFTNFRKGQDIELDLYFASDRYAYLPSIGILLLTALILYKFIHQKQQYLPFLLIFPLGILSLQQSQIWHDDNTFFTYVTDTYPNAHISHINVGILQMKEDPDGAIAEYEKAIAIRPSGRAYYNMGLAYIEKGQRQNALGAFIKAVEINPMHARASVNLGALLHEQGKYEDAHTAFENAIDADPYFILAYTNLSALLEEEGKLDEAKDILEQALQLNPQSIDALVGLANVAIMQYRTNDALQLLKRAIDIDNTDPRYPSLLQHLQALQE